MTGLCKFNEVSGGNPVLPTQQKKVLRFRRVLSASKRAVSLGGKKKNSFLLVGHTQVSDYELIWTNSHYFKVS